MTRSEFLFAAIDVIFHPFQNYRRYPGMVRGEEVIYDEAHPESCRAEFYYDPASIEKKAKLPVVVNIHGGGFVKGDKKHRNSLSKRFAEHGYFVMNVNYRLAPKNPFPASCLDCVSALNYLKKTEEKYNLDLGRVCITGDSSGAYFAAYTAALAFNPGLREKLGAPEFEVKPSLLVGFCGPYDMPAALKTKLPFRLVWDIGRCFIGLDFGLKKDFSNLKEYRFFEELSPTNFVNSDWCPSFLVMSDKDLFCAGHGEILAEKLRNAGVEVETFAAHKITQNHCFHMDFGKKISKECFRRAFEFMDARLKDSAETAESETTTAVAETAAAEESEK